MPTKDSSSSREETPAKEDQDSSQEGRKEERSGPRSGPPWYRRPLVVGPLIFLVIAGVVAVVLIWRHSRTVEKTDDAYIDVVSSQVSSQVSGRVVRVLVDDNQDVRAGQVLVELDPADYEARLDQARATQAQAAAQSAEAKAQQLVYSAQAEEARANLGTAQANATNAARQLARYQALKKVNAGAVSAQQMDSALAADTSARAQLNAAGKAVAAADAQMGYARSLMAAAQAGIGSADSQVRQAELTRSYTHVKARVDGRVATKTVSEGNFISAGAPLMALVPREVWITANFKETQLRRMRVGQPVKVEADAYPDLKLTGKVSSVQPASGQAFSELPAQNATGNWVKVVQRVPVKITIDRLPDDPAIRLGPGMSVEVTVKVR